MIVFLVKLGLLFSLFTGSAVAVDPIIPSIVKTGVFSTVVINETQKYISTNSTDAILQMPFDFTSLSESIEHTYNSNNTMVGTFSITSARGAVTLFILFFEKQGTSTFTPPTFGPCAGNALSYKHQPVWSFLNFGLSNLTGIQLTFSFSRIYQDAALTPEVPQWILFGPGMSNYYAISVTNRSGEALQIDVQRHNSSVPTVSIIFSSVILATEQKCLNPGSSDQGPAGTIEMIDLRTGNLDSLASRVFSALLPPNSIIYVVLHQNDTHSFVGLDFAYSITAKFVPIPSPSPKPDDTTGIVLGVIIAAIVLGVLLVLGYHFKKKMSNYTTLT